MSLVGTTNEQKIWNFLIAQGLSAYGAAGLMGNIYCESGFMPDNLQNTGNTKLKMTDAQYTSAVDSGAYTNFAKDGQGYGLCQWTYSTRKAGLLAYAKQTGKSVGDLEMQLQYLMKEMRESFKAVLSTLQTAATVKAASDAVLTKFERPADQSDAAKSRRASCGQTYFDKFAGVTQSSAVSGAVPMTEQQLRQRVADIMTGWVGATKGSAKHLEILEIYNGYKPLARGYPMKVSDAYCAATVSAAYIKAGIAQYTGTECGVQKYVNIAKSKGIWVENDAHIPKIGDACVFDWDDNGKGDCTGSGDHIGIVTKVGAGTFITTEGNMSGGKVGTRQMNVNGIYIRGFITPDFAAIAANMSATGDTGGATPAPAPSAGGGTTVKVEAAKFFDRSVARAYTVTAASGLHIRAGAGTGKASLGVLKKGTTVRCYGYYNKVGSTLWLYVVAGGITGYVCKTYLK